VVCNISDRLYAKIRGSNIDERKDNKVSDTIPITEKSSVGYNPALDRRMDLQLNSKLKSYLNKNYIVDNETII